MPLRCAGIIVMASIACHCAGVSAADNNKDAAFIASQLKVRKGLAFDIGCGDAQLTLALAQATGLRFYCVESDEKSVELARSAIDAKGLYGVRASAGPADFNALALPDHCAALVICGDQFAQGLRGRSLKEIYRILSPNGVAMIGQGAGVAPALNRAELERWLKDAQISSYEILTQNGLWARVTRPHEKGWDEWTHRAHDAANTFASNDTTLAGLSFKPKWYTGAITGLSGAAVAVSNGRIIFSGMGYAAAPETTPFIQVLDAFTGVELWSKVGAKNWPVDRPMGTYSNRENSQDMTVVGDTLYLLASKFCQVVNLETGAIEKSIAIPKEAKPADDDVWLYVSQAGGTLFCAAGKPPGVKVDWNTMIHRGMSSSIFALDLKTHSLLWTVNEPAWISSIAAGGGQVYYCNENYQLHAVDAKSGSACWKAQAAYPPRTAIAGGAFYNDKYFVLNNLPAATAAKKPEEENKEEGEAAEKKPQPPSADPLTPSALLTSGHNRRKLDAYSARDGKFLFAADFGKTGIANVSFANNSIYGGSQHSNGLLAASAEDGKLKWTMGVSTKCSPTIASPKCLYMRAHVVTSVFDIAADPNTKPKTASFGGFRPTCSYPCVPAYGMLFIQAEGCNCSAAIRGNLAMTMMQPVAPLKDDPLVKGPAYSKPLSADDPAAWASWRGNAGRSGRSAEKLPAALKQQWTLKLPGELTPLAAGHGLVFCGSSAHKLHAVDLATGKQRWQHIAAGRVAIAPFLSQGRIYFTDDAGWAYCLVAETGEPAWRFRAAPQNDAMIVDEAISSRWPCGAGVIVHDNTAYLAAGMFPSQGTHVYALNATTGALSWTKACGAIEGTPTGYVARGPMALSGSKLFITTGVGTPWTVSLEKDHVAGLIDAKVVALKKTTDLMPVGEKVFVSTPDIELVHHAQYKRTSAPRCLPIVQEDQLYRVNHSASGLAALKTTDELPVKPPKPAPGKSAPPPPPPQPVLWSAWKNESMTALIEAGGTLFCGGKGKVYATAGADGKELWSASVPNTVRDLAVCSGRLLVLSGDGELTCFGQ